MRLMHMGLNVYVCGETITPNLKKEDVLIIVSGSGESASLVKITEKAKQIGALAASVREYLDIIEVGTPIVLENGMEAVRQFCNRFPGN